MISSSSFLYTHTFSNCFISYFSCNNYYGLNEFFLQILPTFASHTLRFYYWVSHLGLLFLKDSNFYSYDIFLFIPNNLLYLLFCYFNTQLLFSYSFLADNLWVGLGILCSLKYPCLSIELFSHLHIIC